MPGQPNRKPGKPAEPIIDPVTGRPAGVGARAIDADWGPTTDAVELAKRLERRSRQVEKLKADRADLKAALRLKTEEAFVEGQLSIAPLVVDVRKKLAETAADIVNGSIDEDSLKVLKVALQQLDRWEDRTYGKTRQRVDTTSSSFSMDLTELMKRKGAAAELPGVAAEVVDAEVVDEEMIE